METADTKWVGNIAELEVQTYMTKLKVHVSIPYGDRSRYDHIWDVNGRLLRVQIKHAHETINGAIEIKCSSSIKRKGKRIQLRYTADEIDGIATYYEGHVYYIPVEKTARTVKTLRFNKPLSNIQTTVNWATDYEVEKQLNLL